MRSTSYALESTKPPARIRKFERAARPPCGILSFSRSALDALQFPPPLLKDPPSTLKHPRTKRSPKHLEHLVLQPAVSHRLPSRRRLALGFPFSLIVHTDIEIIFKFLSVTTLGKIRPKRTKTLSSHTLKRLRTLAHLSFLEHGSRWTCCLHGLPSCPSPKGWSQRLGI